MDKRKLMMWCENVNVLFEISLWRTAALPFQHKRTRSEMSLIIFCMSHQHVVDVVFLSWHGQRNSHIFTSIFLFIKAWCAARHMHRESLLICVDSEWAACGNPQIIHDKIEMTSIKSSGGMWGLAHRIYAQMHKPNAGVGDIRLYFELRLRGCAWVLKSA